MKKYEHGGNIYGKEVRHDFSVNTNPFGIDGEIKNAAVSSASEYGIYPDANYTELKNALAEYENVPPQNIAVSNGASEMIFAAVRAVMPQRAVLISPTFSEYERALASVGCEIVYYEAKEENNFEIGTDFPNYLDSADMAFICNPNNPTGTLCNTEIITAAAEKKAVCVADECFMDFTDGVSAKGKLPVIKAFTKTHAMAGLRLGYMIAGSGFITKINEHLPTWNISSPSAYAGIAAAKRGKRMDRVVTLIKTERAYLGTELEKLGFKVFQADANFLLIKGKEGIETELLKRGILIRACDNFRGLDSRFYRIAVKTHEENEILVKELGDIVG